MVYHIFGTPCTSLQAAQIFANLFYTLSGIMGQVKLLGYE